MRRTPKDGDPRRHPAVGRLTALVVCGVLLIAACGDDDDVADPVAAAQARVTEAERAVGEAQTAFDEASAVFCEEAEVYLGAIDGYGKIFDETAVTVGDVKTAGADLLEPREDVQSSADDVLAAREDLREAEQDLVDAEATLAAAQSSTSGPSASSTTTTTAPLLPPATVDRVEEAESDLADATKGITDQTPLRQASAQLNAAAFSLEVAWLRLFADAGCLTDEQQVRAQNAVGEYTVALQTSLETAGYYDDEIDGVYGPLTVDAVEALQKESNLPVTGLVDRATSAALSAAVLKANGEAAVQAVAHTTVVQSTLKLAGFWPGPVDGKWTPELTTALTAFQTALDVEPTGVVDAATLSALQQAITDAKTAATSTTTSTTAATTTTSTTAATTTTTAPVTSTTAAR